VTLNFHSPNKNNVHLKEKVNPTLSYKFIKILKVTKIKIKTGAMLMPATALHNDNL